MNKIKFLLISFLMFSLFDCGCNPEKKTDAKKMLPGFWSLKTLNGKEIDRNRAGEGTPYMEINLTADTLSGYTGCNNIERNISVTDSLITFSNMSTSKIFCPDAEYESDIINLTFHSDPVKYKIDNNLLTFFKGDNEIMKFERAIKTNVLLRK